MGLEVHISKKHQSLLDHDSDLDTSGEDDVQIEEEQQGHEEEDASGKTLWLFVAIWLLYSYYL
jgi:hypothetical protein